MVRTISEVHGKRIILTKLFNPILHLMSNRVGIVNKVFGNLVYEQEMSDYKENYRVRSFKKTIELTERG